jgi:dihydrofolate reductase
MGEVKAEMSMSLDGFIAGPDDTIEQGLGVGGERLHEWLYNLTSWRAPHGLEGGTVDSDSALLAEGMASIGACVMGRRMFDLSEGAWGDTPPFHMPVFVLTHRPHAPLVKAGGTTFTFVTDGLESALRQARAAAGAKDVAVAGGASIIQQCIQAGLLAEIHIHLVPILLGGGRRLFGDLGTGLIELERIHVIDSPSVTHLKFRFGNQGAR